MGLVWDQVKALKQIFRTVYMGQVISVSLPIHAVSGITILKQQLIFCRCNHLTRKSIFLDLFNAPSWLVYLIYYILSGKLNIFILE